MDPESDICIVIAGSGNLAQAIIGHLDQEGIAWRRFEPDLAITQPERTAAIHCGSGREFQALACWCGRHEIPIIQASTGLDTENICHLPIINAPNMALPVIKFYSLLAHAAQSFPGAAKTIVESHQRSKKTLPGTAVRMAGILGVMRDAIRSIRAPIYQLLMGVPWKHLKGHAVHHIRLIEDGVEIHLEACIVGREPYARGALHLARLIIEHRRQLYNRPYEVEELLAMSKRM